MTTDELRNLQADIREEQRRRIDEIHDLCHEADREASWRRFGGEPKEDPFELFEQVNLLCHDFFRAMDEAILIHRRIAELDGRDPAEVDGALWPVRTMKGEPPETDHDH